MYTSVYLFVEIGEQKICRSCTLYAKNAFALNKRIQQTQGIGLFALPWAILL